MNFALSSEDLKVLNFRLSLRDRCLALAEAQAWEIDGEIDRIEAADLEAVLAGLTEDSLEETASDVAHLAAFCN